MCVAVSCAWVVPAEAAQSGAQPPVKIQRGDASYLGKKFHGRRTANGEIYDEECLTAAHKTIPFGTVLRVTRLSNGRAVLVRINDRGPFIKGRFVDLSLIAARKLNMLRGGVTTVQFEVISDTRGVPLRRDQAFYLAFETAGSRQEAEARLKDVHSVIPDKVRRQAPRTEVFEREQDPRLPRYFVGMGPFESFSEAHKVFKRLPAKNKPDVICAKASPNASPNTSSDLAVRDTERNTRGGR